MYKLCKSEQSARRQRQLEEGGIEPLMARLREVDPESAERLHPSDEKRVLRALEVYLETGKTITQHNEETKSIPPRYEAVWSPMYDPPASRSRTL